MIFVFETNGAKSDDDEDDRSFVAFASALCLAWFVLFLSGLYQQSRFISFVNSAHRLLSCARYTRSNVTTDPWQRSRPYSAYSFIRSVARVRSRSFRPIRPMEHSITYSIPLATCPLSVVVAVVPVRFWSLPALFKSILSSIFNDGQHC